MDDIHCAIAEDALMIDLDDGAVVIVSTMQSEAERVVATSRGLPDLKVSGTLERLEQVLAKHPLS